MYFIFLVLFSINSSALNIATSIPDLAEIVQSIGKDQVDVFSLLSGDEDPHFLQASPYFITKVARVDIFCVVGFDLEVSWAPKVIEKSNNKKIQTGSKGYCDAGKYVKAIGKAQNEASRSMGDVHRKGNPHYNLSPIALIDSSRAILEVLVTHKPDQAEFFKENQKQFEKNMISLHKQIQEKLNGHPVKLIQYHKEFDYFFNLYNLKNNGSIESLPGVPPSSTALAKVALDAKNQSLNLALGSHYSPEKHLKKFTEISKIPHIKLPTLVHKSNPTHNSISKLQHYIADQILQNIKKAE